MSEHPLHWLRRYMRLVAESDLGVNDRLVAAAIASHADGDGVCFPSDRQLSELTGLDERSHARIRRRLIDAGLLEREVREGRRNLYRLILYPVEGPVDNPETPRRAVRGVEPVQADPTPRRAVRGDPAPSPARPPRAQLGAPIEETGKCTEEANMCEMRADAHLAGDDVEAVSVVEGVRQVREMLGASQPRRARPVVEHVFDHEQVVRDEQGVSE